jgi:outer membrane receptor protein involved in Fe transport
MKHDMPKRNGGAPRTTPSPIIAAAIAGVLTGVTCCPQAAAQTAAASPAASGTLEEIVVTATRRAQSVEDIPFNISAVSGKQMAAQISPIRSICCARYLGFRWSIAACEIRAP